MSFDLYLRADNLPFDLILQYLDQHPNFQRQEFSDGGYGLVNQDTGVYCYFRVDDGEDSDKKSLCFSLNYNRPTFFALETMPLIENLCQRFGLLVEDPQEDFVGPVSLPALINSWRIHNERTVKALKAQGMKLNYMPEIKANEWWAYTRVREQMAQNFGDSVFVPEVFILKRPTGEPFRMIVWPEGNRQLLPASDVVWIDRSDNEALSEEGTDGFVDGEHFLELVAPYTSEYRFGSESFRLLDPVSFPEVNAKTRKLELKPIDVQHEGVAPDGFHNVVLD